MDKTVTATAILLHLHSSFPWYYRMKATSYSDNTAFPQIFSPIITVITPITGLYVTISLSSRESLYFTKGHPFPPQNWIWSAS